MKKSYSIGAIAVLVFMVFALTISGYVSGDDIRFHRPDRISASIANYNRMVERNSFLAAVRNNIFSLRDFRLETSLTKAPGESAQSARRRLDQPF